MSGAFNGLEDVIRKRLKQKTIGCGADVHSKDEPGALLKYVKSEDLINFGFESEFIGRLPVVTIFEHLETEDLSKILRNPKSPIIVGKKRDFKAYGIDLQFEDDALRKIAEDAFRERTGARGLVSAVEKVLVTFEHTLPSTTIRRLVVTSAMVDDPCGELNKILLKPDDPVREAAFERLLNEEVNRLENAVSLKREDWEVAYGIRLSPQRVRLVIHHALERQTDVEETFEEFRTVEDVAREFAEAFSERNDLDLSFTDDAIDALAAKAWTDSAAADPAAYLRTALKNYDHGLKLIREKTNRRDFSISAEGITCPEGFLTELIQAAYR
jgi:ATP-dependent protease Clp ATPase subunit